MFTANNFSGFTIMWHNCQNWQLSTDKMWF